MFLKQFFKAYWVPKNRGRVHTFEWRKIVFSFGSPDFPHIYFVHLIFSLRKKNVLELLE